EYVVLVDSTRDFGYFGGDKDGRYSPWRSAASQQKFKDDLIRMLNLVLSGKKEQLSRKLAGANHQPDQIATLPRFSLTDLSGRPLSSDQLSGRAVLVEFWAPWCPPCRSTLEWLASLKRQYGDRIAIVTLAIDSPESEVRKAAGSVSSEVHWAMSDAKTAVAFGDIVSGPALVPFHTSGKTAQGLYRAPPDIREHAEKSVVS